MINQFGSIYSKYYDLLYKDKDYGLEAKYILNILKNNINICYRYRNNGENHDKSTEEKSPAAVLLQG